MNPSPTVITLNSYAAIATKLARAFANTENVVVRQDCIRASAKLTNNSTGFVFNLSNDGGTQIVDPVEKRIQKNDLFVPVSMGLGICKTVTATFPAQSNASLKWYVDTAVFAAANEEESLNALYNGQLTLKSDQTILIDTMPIVDWIAPQDQIGFGDGSQSPLAEQFRNFVLRGDALLQAIIGTAGSTVAIAGGAGEQNYAHLVLRGFTIQGGCSSEYIRTALSVLAGM